MSYGREVKRLRNNLGLTQVDLATMVGIKQPSLVAIETGGGTSAELHHRLCKALRVPLDHFADILVPGVSVPPPPSAAGASHAPVPLLGVVGAGPAVDEAFAPDATILVSIDYVGCVAYLVGGDSLTAAHIIKGDYVIVRASPDPKPGKIVIAYIAGEGCVVKKLAAGGVLVSSVKGDKWRHKLTDGDCIYGEYVGLERKLK